MMSIVMTIRKTALGIPRQVSVSSLVRLQKIRVDEVIFKEKTRNFKFLQEKKKNFRFPLISTGKHNILMV